MGLELVEGKEGACRLQPLLLGGRAKRGVIRLRLLLLDGGWRRVICGGGWTSFEVLVAVKTGGLSSVQPLGDPWTTFQYEHLTCFHQHLHDPRPSTKIDGARPSTSALMTDWRKSCVTWMAVRR